MESHQSNVISVDAKSQKPNRKPLIHIENEVFCLSLRINYKYRISIRNDTSLCNLANRSERRDWMYKNRATRTVPLQNPLWKRIHEQTSLMSRLFCRARCRYNSTYRNRNDKHSVKSLQFVCYIYVEILWKTEHIKNIVCVVDIDRLSHDAMWNCNTLCVKRVRHDLHVC